MEAEEGRDARRDTEGDEARPSSGQDQADVLVGGHPFKTSFPPAARMSPSETEERVAEMKRRAGLPVGALVPPASACDEQITTLTTGVIVGRSRGYVPYEKDSNCDFSGGSSEYPLALIIDGTGHDKGGEAAKHTENGITILKELEKCVREGKDQFSTPQQVLDRILALLRSLDDSNSSIIHHISCTLSAALKVAAGRRTYVLTFHWGDNVIFVINPKKRSVTVINAPLNSDYGIGATHSVSRGGRMEPYSACVYELHPDDIVVGLTDGVWDHLVTESSQAAKNAGERPRLDEELLLDIFAQHEVTGATDESTEARLFEEARRRARAKLEAGALRENELDDMSAFIFPPSVPALDLHPEKGDKKNSKESSDKKGCVLS